MDEKASGEGIHKKLDKFVLADEEEPSNKRLQNVKVIINNPHPFNRNIQRLELRKRITTQPMEDITYQRVRFVTGSPWSKICNQPASETELLLCYGKEE